MSTESESRKPANPSEGVATVALAGIFVGGSSKRMGGRPKGLLRVPGTDERIVERLVRLSREAGLTPILVGDATPYRQLAMLGGEGGAPGAGDQEQVAVLADHPGLTGPLAGLAALLAEAGEGDVIALACDMPFVTAEALASLICFPPGDAIVSPQSGPEALWEPLFARYHAPSVRPVLRVAAADGVRSFQGLFKRVGPAPLPLDAAISAALEDWDSPADLGG